MQTTSFTDVTSNTFLFNMIAHGVELKDLEGLALANKNYKKILPQKNPLWAYTKNWHTIGMPTSNYSNWIGLHWVWNPDILEGYEVPVDIWKTIFLANDIGAATALLDCDALEQIPEPTQNHYHEYETSHNAVELEELAIVQSSEMLKLLSTKLYLAERMQWNNGDDCSRHRSYGPGPSDCSYYGRCWHIPGFNLDFYNIKLYIFAEEAGRGPQMLAMLHQLGFTNRQIAESIENIDPGWLQIEPENLMCDRFFSTFDYDDPVMQELQHVSLLCNFNWEHQFTLMTNIQPFHIMAAGYDVKDEDKVLNCFIDFMDYDLVTRNEEGGEEDLTVLQIVYKTRPLNRKLLVVLNKKKHNNSIFLI